MALVAISGISITFTLVKPWLIISILAVKVINTPQRRRGIIHDLAPRAKYGNLQKRLDVDRVRA
ncbi:hypothetical protein PSDVSF_24060 [Pseudodesulfovibrio sediminis]|uniref:Uncharacterized protein n=1 Tax=Pseudodesulfovibrio sediminis TaxID=2810563 RepID=A0ABM7P834_9BACT|nr:hypothetical protein PSDVSF_24060 [Pseudodesulfovibrio sediminis]